MRMGCRRIAVLRLVALVVATGSAAAADRECAVSIVTTPPAVRNRVVQTACEGQCRVDVTVCRAANRCATRPAGALEARFRPAVVPATPALPAHDGTCRTSRIVMPPGGRRHLRVMGLDALGRPLDRDRVVLICRPPREEACTTTTTTTTTTTLPSGGCVVSGCNSEICEDTGWASVCIWNPVFACFRTATCEPQADGQCGWTRDDALRECVWRHGGLPGW
jgi:hypothetical protein